MTRVAVIAECRGDRGSVVSVCRCPPAVVKVVGWLWGYRNYGSRTIMGKVTGDPGVR